MSAASYEHHRFSIPNPPGIPLKFHLIKLLSSVRDHFSIVEPVAGCGQGRSTVSKTATHNECLVAMNAGFFAIDQSNGQCLNAVVSDGRVVQIQPTSEKLHRNNAHFGVDMNGLMSIFYINQSIIESLNQLQPSFSQLFGGVTHLVHEGVNQADESWLNDEDHRTPIPPDGFHTMRSARTAIGFDDDNKLMFGLIDGSSHVEGVSLSKFADILINVGFIEAINADGGGSATLVENGQLVNFPSERNCLDQSNNQSNNQSDIPSFPPDWEICERPVTTVACIHHSKDYQSIDQSINQFNQLNTDVSPFEKLINQSVAHPFNQSITIALFIVFGICIVLSLVNLCRWRSINQSNNQSNNQYDYPDTSTDDDTLLLIDETDSAMTTDAEG